MIDELGLPLNGMTKKAAKSWLERLRVPTVPAKTASERVVKLRADREALGLKRLELYAHPEDWQAIKALAEKLQRRRALLVAKRAP